MRKAARVDTNQKEIVDALRKVGAGVISLAAVGKGVPDLLVFFRGKLRLIEIKDGNKPPSQRKLTPDQQAFHALWSGGIDVAKNVDEALEIIFRS